MAAETWGAGSHTDKVALESLGPFRSVPAPNMKLQDLLAPGLIPRIGLWRNSVQWRRPATTIRYALPPRGGSIFASQSGFFVRNMPPHPRGPVRRRFLRTILRIHLSFSVRFLGWPETRRAWRRSSSCVFEARSGYLQGEVLVTSFEGPRAGAACIQGLCAAPGFSEQARLDRSVSRPGEGREKEESPESVLSSATPQYLGAARAAASGPSCPIVYCFGREWPPRNEENMSYGN